MQADSPLMAEHIAHPLTPERWEDLVTVFGGGDGKGDCGRCWCMWWRLPRQGIGEGLGKGNKALFKARVDAGPPPGLVGYDEDGVPIGWVQVGPRADVPEWNGARRLTAPLDFADAADPGVWAISCFVVRTGHRRRGHFTELLDAAINWARENDARALDACPVDTNDRRPASALYHGLALAFRKRGFLELTRRRSDRPLMRLELMPG
jgi:ribosomal protein S18 acetylase RimI-like enzyme